MIRVVFSLLICSGFVVTQLTYLQRLSIIREHNADRSIDATTAGSNLRKMNWNKDLAARAQTYANKCEFKHSNSYESGIGENLFFSTGKSFPDNVQKGVNFWYKEKSNYHFSDNSCDDGEMCGHYKQMVWAKASQVGCGLKLCASLKYTTANNAYYLICNYNKIVMARTKPYIKDDPCSNCPAYYQRCSEETNFLCRYGTNKRGFEDIISDILAAQKMESDEDNSVQRKSLRDILKLPKYK